MKYYLVEDITKKGIVNRIVRADSPTQAMSRVTYEMLKEANGATPEESATTGIYELVDDINLLDRI
ncbi:hypothetical protein ACPBEI_00825 [Latilactobacillus sakei]